MHIKLFYQQILSYFLQLFIIYIWQDRLDVANCVYIGKKNDKNKRWVKKVMTFTPGWIKDYYEDPLKVSANLNNL